MRFLHTSDWHLGHQLQRYDRSEEHRAFLRWLLERADKDQVDALLVAGDIYQSSNPPASAERLFYDFLGDIRTRLPDLKVIITAGNHDSAPRLGAARALYRTLGVTVISALPFGQEIGDALVPIDGKDRRFWVGAVPFLRPSDLSPEQLRTSPSAAVAERYNAISKAYREARGRTNEPLVLMGHAHIRGGNTTDSERDLIRGDEEALPPDVFGNDASYIALGHLHLAQRVDGGCAPIHYCGSPIPLSMGEASYPHQVLRVDLDESVRIASIRVPRHAEMIRFQTDAPRPLEETVAALEAADFGPVLSESQQPFLEVGVFVESPKADLAERILDAIEGKGVRLLKIHTRRATVLETRLGDRIVDRDLGDLDPEEVLIEMHRAQRDGALPEEALLRAFRTLRRELAECES